MQGFCEVTGSKVMEDMKVKSRILKNWEPGWWVEKREMIGAEFCTSCGLWRDIWG